MEKNYLVHFGIKGQKWGERRFQNIDGSYTEKGQSENNGRGRYYNYTEENNENSNANKTKIGNKKLKKVAIIGLSVVGSALVAYGGYKLYKSETIQQFINKGKTFSKQQLDELGIKTVEVDKIDVFKENLGAKNLEFIRESGVFESQHPKINNSELCKSIIESFNDEQKKIFDPEQLKTLTDDQLRSMKIYSTNWYHDINHFFRKDGDVIRDANTVKDICKNIKEVFQKVTLSNDVNVSRGIDQSTAKDILFGSDLYSKIMKLKDGSSSGVLDDIKGFINMDPGVMSTSANTKGKVIESFSGKNGIIIDLLAKAGQSGFYLEPLSEAPYEREIAFAPNSAVQFTGDYKVVNGIVHLIAELVQ